MKKGLAMITWKKLAFAVELKMACIIHSMSIDCRVMDRIAITNVDNVVV